MQGPYNISVNSGYVASQSLLLAGKNIKFGCEFDTSQSQFYNPCAVFISSIFEI